MSRVPTIALLGGDGIGPEVVGAGRTVLEVVARLWGHELKFVEALIGGVAMEATGQPLPPATLKLCRAADAVLLGAAGGPQWDSPTAKVRPEQGLLGLRQALGLFANIRPIRPLPELAHASPLKPEILKGTDLVVVRELTGGIYFGNKTRTGSGAAERATDVCAYTTREIVRVTRVAAELARQRSRRLTSVDKANILETSRLWRRIVTRVIEREFPDVQLNHLLVDTCAMRLVNRPTDFDVIVTENTFGDILTDEAAVIVGSIGLLPSASLGARAAPGPRGSRRTASAMFDGRRIHGLYEPVHGTAPDIAGKGIANPLGTILSVAMLLRHSLGLESEASAVEAAVETSIRKGTVTSDLAGGGLRGHPTSEVVNRVVQELERSRRAG